MHKSEESEGKKSAARPRHRVSVVDKTGAAAAREMGPERQRSPGCGGVRGNT